MALSLALFASASALAAQPLAFVSTCLQAEDDIDTIATTLIDQGWEQVGKTSETAVSDLSWVLSSYYFNSDSGGESVTSILELQTKTAAAMLKKKDIPQSKSRIFVRDTDDAPETLRVTWQQPIETLTEYGCQAALSASSTTTLRGDASDDLPAFFAMPLQNIGNGYAAFTLLNAAKLAPLTPPNAIVITQAERRGES
ncbi:MAG: hypothetical protein ABJF50_09605 [Paracoccaceae bacterium]